MSDRSPLQFPKEPLTPDVAAASKFQRALGIYYINKFGGLLLAFFFQIFVAKTLSPSEYATYAILLATLMASERFLSIGIDRTVLRFVPSLTAHKNLVALRWLLTRIAFARLITLILMVAAVLGLAPTLGPLLPVPPSDTTVHAFALWYVSYSLLSDFEAFGQSWMAHVDVSVAATLEAFARCAAIVVLLIYAASVDAGIVVLVSAITSTASLCVLLIRARGLRKRVQQSTLEFDPNRHPVVDVKEAPMFAFAAYGSTLGWLVTSPSVIRIVAKSGLDVLTFAAFSFVQGLCISLQRGLPGLLLLPSLEPVMARTARERMFAVLSFVFKIELIGVLAIATVMMLAGPNLISLLSRSVYAPFYYVMPAFLFVLVLQTIYRICEIVMSAQLEYRLFLALWPLSLVSVVVLYLTADRWGLMSVLIVPAVEGLLRIAIIMAVYRRAEIWRALDPVLSLQLTLSAAMVVSIALLVQRTGAFGSEILLAAVATVVFLGSFFVIRPFNQKEFSNLISALPASLAQAKGLMRALSRT